MLFPIEKIMFPPHFDEQYHKEEKFRNPATNTEEDSAK